MNKTAVQIALSMILVAGMLPCLAEDEQTSLLSMVPHARTQKTAASAKARAKAKALASKKAGGKTAGKTAGKSGDKSGVKSGVKSAAPARKATAQTGDSTSESATGEAGQQEPEAPPPRSYYSSALEAAVKQYRANPSTQAYGQMLEALKATLSGAGAFRVQPASLVKDNPYLADFKPRVIETNGVRFWNFPRAAERTRALLQWLESKQQIVGTGRRKRVVTTTSMHLQELPLVSPINVRDAGLVFTKECGRHLILSGENEEGALLVQSYKLNDNVWQASPDYLGQIPAFLTTNVSGRVSFKGSDLVFNLGRMIQTTDSSGTRRLLSEAESATYKFWLKQGENGYVVTPTLSDEEAFSVVLQFMQAVQQSRPDQQKALLADARLASLPKYLGLQGSTCS
jgi:hypothetical protein